MQLWRISNHCDLEGLGGERSDGRWHTAARGKRIVYLSEHPALALIETIANLKGNPSLFPDKYQLLKLTAAGSVSVEILSSESLKAAWRANARHTRQIGDAWLISRRSALLEVPSSPSPESKNYLFNPLHPDGTGVQVEWCKWIEYDKRLFHIHDSSSLIQLS